jgi:rRNA-processing protein EBP2
MGKKDRANGLKRKRQEEHESDDEDAIDPELQAEMNALASMRAEKGLGDEDADEEPAAKGKANNTEGLLRAVEVIGNNQLSFKETMQVCQFECDVEDENDDLARELAFYNHSLAAVEFGIAKLHEAGVPTMRPVDYFCEQMKTDAHMTKIKDSLILEEKKMEAFDQRKNREMNKKFNKQLQTQKKESKQSKEKEEISSFKKFRMGSGEDSEKLEEALNNSVGKSGKRKAMDKKYGFGGKDRLSRKLVDKKSLNDLSKYDPRGGKTHEAMQGRGGRGAGGRSAGGRGGGDGGRGGHGAGGRGGRGGGDRDSGGRGGGGRGGGGRGGGGRGGGGRGGGRGGSEGRGGGRGSANRPGKDARTARRK